MKKLLLVLCMMPLAAMSQNFIMQSNVTADTTTRQFVANSPSNTFGNRRDVTILKDSTLSTSLFRSLRHTFYGTSVRNDGAITGNIAWWDNDGYLKGSPASSLSILSAQVISALGFTPYNSTNPNNYLGQAGVRASISVTATGTGAATYNNSTGVINIPTPVSSKRIETYVGTTDGSGNYTVTYGTAFSSTPDVQPQLQGGTVNQQVRITASSTTGFTVQATQRAVLSVLGLDVLAGTATALASASVGVLVTQR